MRREPSIATLGAEATFTVWLIVQHALSDYQLRYYELLSRWNSAGLVADAEMAYLDDRIMVAEEGVQVYGSQFGNDPETGEQFLQPLKYPDAVDSLRARVSLGPLREYYEQMGVPYTPPGS